MKRVVAAMAAASVLLLVGCGGDETVGEGLQTEGFEEGDDGRLGERASTTTSAAPVETTVPAAQEATTTTAAGPQVAIEISIRADDAPSQFEPSIARIYAGTCARFVNTDTVVRSVVADDASFESGDIAPGASHDICPTQAGRFNYHDGTRPYAVGSLEVLAR